MANNFIRLDVAREIESISSNDEVQNRTLALNYLNPSLNETEMVGIVEALSRSTLVEKVNLTGSLRRSPAAATSTFLKKIFETHPSIQDIDLMDNNISDNLAEVIGLALRTNTSLKVLWLYRNYIGAHGAEALAEGLSQNKSLKIFYLGLNQIVDRGAKALAEALRFNKTLEILSLGENGVTVNGAEALASALEKASLKELYLNDNILHDEGCKTLAKSLCKNKRLTIFNLRATSVGNEACKALAAALCNNSTLRELDLNENDRISTIGVTAFEDTLKHINYKVENIRLSYGTTVEDHQVELIHHLCEQNSRINAFFQRINDDIAAIPLGVWPKVLETVECKPDLLYAFLKEKPELCQERQRNRRRRRRPDWLRCELH